jgi:hypothetical protein
VLIRTDLSVEQQLVQAVHAAYEAGKKDPSQAIHSTVICAVPDEASLLHAEERLKRHGISSTIFREPDIGNQATALCSEPISGALRKAFSIYPLWRVQEPVCV